jgi:hypothetical protein
MSLGLTKVPVLLAIVELDVPWCLERDVVLSCTWELLTKLSFALDRSWCL